MNHAVFSPLFERLQGYRVHYVDLPGFGHSDPVEGELMAWVDHLIEHLPDNSIWLGWSLGGLVATQLALTYPDKVRGLITVASSPCFLSKPDEHWAGMDPKVLSLFSEQLQSNIKKTVERFLAIQAMGSKTAKQEIKQLKHDVLTQPLPAQQALAQGLSFLQKYDLRNQATNIKLPWLRLWGRLDSLVPKAIIEQMPTTSNTTDVIMHDCAHAPFFSHPEEFCDILLKWLHKYS
ncbi:pimeloyl-[acyl-carrier protein] methyl ester esterase [Parashewanella curva]|uniref:Pimeloyl-[acyl-carrier protein] methyl ester esterase n=2 Tax=Parashewanella curva TaxID=2338552 RepID=A0A3L8Q0J3_9GAMM|nr:pimeloyl-[acyl-carrier protein] methyl ester esterase [Parashewanella curva]